MDEPQASEAGDMECEVDTGDVKLNVKPGLAILASVGNNGAGTSSDVDSSSVNWGRGAPEGGGAGGGRKPQRLRFLRHLQAG